MQKLPHIYHVTSDALPDSNLKCSSHRLANIEVAPPEEFGGPGDHWSPETLFMSALSNCYILSFKAVSKALKLDWIDISCDSEGILDRAERTTRFVKVTNNVKLTIKDEDDREKAEKLLEKAEHICLVSNSINAELVLEFEISVL
ncbi:MAG TPA: OsmC family peroxiredoxin [Psychromonas hadalis]|nr:OsmC family peroxiredoxin [Psychromonas hadalis]